MIFQIAHTEEVNNAPLGKASLDSASKEQGGSSPGRTHDDDVQLLSSSFDRLLEVEDKISGFRRAGSF